MNKKENFLYLYIMKILLICLSIFFTGESFAESYQKREYRQYNKRGNNQYKRKMSRRRIQKDVRPSKKDEFYQNYYKDYRINGIV